MRKLGSQAASYKRPPTPWNNNSGGAPVAPQRIPNRPHVRRNQLVLGIWHEQMAPRLGSSWESPITLCPYHCSLPFALNLESRRSGGGGVSDNHRIREWGKWTESTQHPSHLQTSVLRATQTELWGHFELGWGWDLNVFNAYKKRPLFYYLCLKRKATGCLPLFHPRSGESKSREWVCCGSYWKTKAAFCLHPTECDMF